MNWLKFTKLYFSISILLIIIGIVSLTKWGLALGVDFKGGSSIEYTIQSPFSSEDLTSQLSTAGVSITSIQSSGEKKYILKSGEITEEQRKKISQIIKEVTGSEPQELQFQQVGPSMSIELIKKTVYAIVVASVLILFWVAYQFKSFKYGVTAILAMLHDTFILIGLFALMGYLWNAEADFLFFTAVLTTLSFSVHDTIVVFDRIREIYKKQGGDLVDISNRAITETMVRSLNNSFTIIFMLLALILLGGSTIKWFAIALLIGTILGTYSSPFVAVPILVSWDKVVEKLKRK